VVAAVKQRPRWIHTGANGKIADLIPAGTPPNEYVTTPSDRTLANNLGQQPRCR
jgi:hypothetical protein